MPASPWSPSCNSGSEPVCKHALAGAGIRQALADDRLELEGTDSNLQGPIDTAKSLLGTKPSCAVAVHNLDEPEPSFIVDEDLEVDILVWFQAGGREEISAAIEWFERDVGWVRREGNANAGLAGSAGAIAVVAATPTSNAGGSAITDAAALGGKVAAIVATHAFEGAAGLAAIGASTVATPGHLAELVSSGTAELFAITGPKAARVVAADRLSWGAAIGTAGGEPTGAGADPVHRLLVAWANCGLGRRRGTPRSFGIGEGELGHRGRAAYA